MTSGELAFVQRLDAQQLIATVCPRIVCAQVAHGLTMMSGELAFVRRFDAQQQSREENQSSAKHKGSTTTTTAAATAGSKHQERHDRIIRKWRQAAEAIEDLMEQWEGLRGLSQSSIQEVQKGTSSQRVRWTAGTRNESSCARAKDGNSCAGQGKKTNVTGQRGKTTLCRDKGKEHLCRDKGKNRGQAASRKVAGREQLKRCNRGEAALRSHFCGFVMEKGLNGERKS
eukprot:scaffold112093_cov20-Tisochrysis_lutea.AAC.3